MDQWRLCRSRQALSNEHWITKMHEHEFLQLSCVFLSELGRQRCKTRCASRTSSSSLFCNASRASSRALCFTVLIRPCFLRFAVLRRDLRCDRWTQYNYLHRTPIRLASLKRIPRKKYSHGFFMFSIAFLVDIRVFVYFPNILLLFFYTQLLYVSSNSGRFRNGVVSIPSVHLAEYLDDH